MHKYKRGELSFYKSSTPQELRLYLKSNPSLKEAVEYFLRNHTYNRASKSWEKASPVNRRKEL